MSLDDLVCNYNDSVREAVDKHSLVKFKDLLRKLRMCQGI